MDSAPLMKISDGIACSLNVNVDLSSLPTDVRGTSRHLATRHHELGKWQLLTALSISRVGGEVVELEQLKRNIENKLEERQAYAKFISECVKFKEDFDQFVREDVYAELKKEQHLTNEIISHLRNHIVLLQVQLDSLREIYKHLYTDFQDKSEAIKLIASCVTHSNLQESPQTEPKQQHISYDQWKSECNKLQNTCDNLLKRSTNLRGNVQFTWRNLKNACHLQQLKTSKVMRKQIHDMRKNEEEMWWKLQEAQYEMDDLTKMSQKVSAQMRKCKERASQNANNLNVLNQRQGHELCKDQAHNSLALQMYDLTLIEVRTERMNRQVQTKMEAVRRRILVLQRELEAQRKALQTELKCEDLYQSVVPGNKGKQTKLSLKRTECTFRSRCD
uniref:Tektin n=1 Tax=Periophthalmus magnuspinnatus TaxID=409849 RepID=A0A3B4AAM1_9GOBI